MIDFDYIKPSEEKPEGIVKVSVSYDAIDLLEENQFPLCLKHKTMSGEVIWQSNLVLGGFSHFFLNTYTTVNLSDSLGNSLFEWNWDPFIHGDYNHQFFELWSIKNIGANGIAIGTHNGMTGEWVGPVNKGRLKATLVEASVLQYNELLKFYDSKKWVSCINILVTTDGSESLFYEGGDGFTNSLSRKTIEKYVDCGVITKVIKPSVSINDLIVKSSEKDKVRWIHMDVEGMDGELIYAIREDLLPELLLFESLNMEDAYYKDLCEYLKSKKYSITKSGYNTICIK
jgi:hypothetical protein